MKPAYEGYFAGKRARKFRYLFIVTFPSLENIRKSERVEIFEPTASTLIVVLSRYSCTLDHQS
jgi:hypothetical protein